ncbi:MAG: hypothetical protein J5476_02955 [Lachnospiraceae bacterium]|nr:hypothetical protein [Lachnospiraceae bacterium]
MKEKNQNKAKGGIKTFWPENLDLYRDLFDSLALIVLFLYPFRKIHLGLDLWDTGYNLSNFQFMGTDSMDPMWLFSTYLSNAIGHLMSILPYGHTLLGMNFYTSFVPAIMAVCGYLFFTRVIKMPSVAAFVAEFAALSLCWAPTTTLYHYLTYFTIGASCLLLYRGLTENEALTIGISGALCGLGIFVRFSNLPQASLLLAIWLYGAFEFRDAYADREKVKMPSRVDAFRRTMLRGFWFILGYVTAFSVFFVYLGIRYGFADYLEGISELFEIPDNASGYGPVDMIKHLILFYVSKDMLYWVFRLLIIAVGGGAIYFGTVFLAKKYGNPVSVKRAQDPVAKRILMTGRILGAVASGCAVIFLINRNFVIYDYNNYSSVFPLAGLMNFFALCCCLYGVFSPNGKAKHRLLATLSAYSLLISAIGGNNGELYSYNNMFVWFPFLVLVMLEFLKYHKFPWLYGVKCVATGVILFFLYQSTLFGFNFSFTEGQDGAGEVRQYSVFDNKALAHIRMSYDKAYSFERLSEFVEANNLTEKELISFGYIPAVHFYLQMEPAFNPWPDLASYTEEKMSSNLNEIARMIEDSESGAEVGKYYEKPVVIICVDKNAGYSRNEKKWDMIYSFIEKENYKLVYSDSYFELYE